MSLAGILDQPQPVALGQAAQWVHVGALAVQVNGKQCAGRRPHGARGPVRVHRVGVWIHVYQHRCGAG